MFDESLFARGIAGIHAIQLRDSDMRLIHDRQEIRHLLGVRACPDDLGGKIGQQRIRRLASGKGKAAWEKIKTGKLLARSSHRGRLLALELRRTLLQKCVRAFDFVFGRTDNSEERGLDERSLLQVRFQPVVDSFDN